MLRKKKKTNQQAIGFLKKTKKQPPKPLFEDFLGGPVVRTSPSTAGCVGLIPDQRAKIPHAFGQKKTKPQHKKTKNNILTNLIRTLKRIHVKKKKKILKKNKTGNSVQCYMAAWMGGDLGSGI